MMFEQLPPHDIQAEESVIASLLVDQDAMLRVSPIVEPEDFFRESNAWAFEACQALWSRGVAINQVTVAHELDRHNRLEEIGGLAYLSELVLNLPTPVGVEHYAAIVKRDATYRRMISAAMSIAQIGYEARTDVDSSIARAEALVFGLRTTETEQAFTHLRQFLDPIMAEPAAASASSHNQTAFTGHLRTGLSDLDQLLAGLGPEELIVIAARTGAGKTSLMLNLARHAAVGQNAKVAIFSLEMGGEQLAQRLLAAEARLDLKHLQFGSQDESGLSRLMHAHGRLASSSVYIDDSTSLTMPRLRAKAMQLQREKGLDLLIVDYLQLIQGAGNRGRTEEIAGITRKLKELARELRVPIVIGSQLSRAPDQRPDHMPQLSDLRDSGTIEQDADIVVFIYREESYSTRQQWEAIHPDRMAEPYPEGIAQLIVAKQRQGARGVIEARFHDKFFRFEDFASSPTGGFAAAQGRLGD